LDIDFAAPIYYAGNIVLLLGAITLKLSRKVRATAIYIVTLAMFIATIIPYYFLFLSFLSAEPNVPQNAVFIIGVIIFGILILEAICAYVITKQLLGDLDEKGYLQKFKILDLENGKWDINQNPLPGRDGTSPEEQLKKARSAALILPVAGIVFLLIRTLPQSITPLVASIYLGIAMMFTYGCGYYVGHLAYLKSLEKKVKINISTLD
jgi:hypothetical protein